ncbi:MAG TPA: class IV adenylate cyclase [Candidatus Paceibacterota bacterium]
MQEIERKFLVRSLPHNLTSYPHKEIEQGYIVISEDGTSIRLRKKEDEYSQAVKKGFGKVRDETQILITNHQFEILWPLTDGTRLTKTRHYIPCEPTAELTTIELDIYHGELEDLAIAEVEFSTEEASNQFIVPGWFGKEVTNDSRYYNQSIALYGMPEDVQREAKTHVMDFGIPRYVLYEGMAVLNELTRISGIGKDVSVIAIAGGSASGKTSAVAKSLKESFGSEAIMLPMDDYYRGIDFMQAQAAIGNRLNFDQPEVINFDLLNEHLVRLKGGLAIQKPIYSFRTGKIQGTESVSLGGAHIIILEGIFALHDSLKDSSDVKVFVEIGVHGRIMRRLLRDVGRTGQSPSEILEYFAGVVEPMHEKHVEITKTNADIIITNEYDAGSESEKSGEHEVQLKLRASLRFADKKLRNAGAEYLGQVTQVDTYYNPPDRDLSETGELLRIRQEGSDYILTYKGPRISGELRTRAKFEFKITEAVKNKFLSIYSNTAKVIAKERSIYRMGNITITLDRVEHRFNGQDSLPLGEFMEIRTNDTGAKSEIEKVFAELGLNPADVVQESYFEM